MGNLFGLRVNPERRRGWALGKDFIASDKLQWAGIAS